MGRGIVSDLFLVLGFKECQQCIGFMEITFPQLINKKNIKLIMVCEIYFYLGGLGYLF